MTYFWVNGLGIYFENLRKIAKKFTLWWDFLDCENNTERSEPRNNVNAYNKKISE